MVQYQDILNVRLPTSIILYLQNDSARVTAPRIAFGSCVFRVLSEAGTYVRQPNVLRWDTGVLNHVKNSSGSLSLLWTADVVTSITHGIQTICSQASWCTRTV